MEKPLKGAPVIIVLSVEFHYPVWYKGVSVICPVFLAMIQEILRCV